MSRFTRILTTGLGLAAALALSTAPMAHADNGIDIAVTGGTRTASIANVSLTGVSYSHSVQAQTGNMTLTADDSTGSGAGWNVTVQSSVFDYTGSATDGADIPAASFSITTANAPAMTAGQAIDATNGPKVPASGATGTLDTAHKVIQSNASYGLGTYTQALAVSLALPAQSRAGDYSALLTVTNSVAP